MASALSSAKARKSKSPIAVALGTKLVARARHSLLAAAISTTNKNQTLELKTKTTPAGLPKTTSARFARKSVAVMSMDVGKDKPPPGLQREKTFTIDDENKRCSFL